MELLAMAGYVLAFTYLYCIRLDILSGSCIRNDYIAGWVVCGGLALVCGIVLIVLGGILPDIIIP